MQGNDFPGVEHPERLKYLHRTVQEAERGYSKGDAEDPVYRTRVEELHSYLDELRFTGNGYRAIDTEGETFIDRLSYRTAMAAAITSMYAAEARAFALVRPPGHHAHRDLTHGFCLLNNMALATKQLLENGERVLVLDIDVHHGCGTEELLEGEPNAHMISIYQKGIWPQDKHFTYAENCTHIPLEGRIQNTNYQRVFEEQVLPEIEHFNPSVIGVSLGLDTFSDEQFGWELTPEILRTIRKILQKRQLFGVLEGGYTARNVREGIAAFVEEP